MDTNFLIKMVSFPILLSNAKKHVIFCEKTILQEVSNFISRPNKIKKTHRILAHAYPRSLKPGELFCYDLTLQTRLSITRDFFRLHKTFARLYKAAASPASRLRSAGPLAINGATKY